MSIGKDMEFLCWVNRCLFSGDLEYELVELGMDEDDARFVSKSARCVVELYQDYCVGPGGEEFKAYVDRWLEMRREKWESLR